MEASNMSDDWIFVEAVPEDHEIKQLEAKQFKAKQPEADEETRRYKYEELPSSNHFRLLRLSAKKTYGDAIHCQLVVFEIDSPRCPAYRAVSYAWGNDGAHRIISVGDYKLRVRKNLVGLLHCVRDDAHDCWLWIDAICIDQTSYSERNHQVKLMGEIYSRANTVLAWLGSEDREIERAFTFILNAVKVGVVYYCRLQSESDFEWGNGVNVKTVWEHNWNCLAKFSQLWYWTRRWIIQEVVVARSVVLQAGGLKLAMEHVEDFFGQLKQNPYTDAKRQQYWEKNLCQLQVDECPPKNAGKNQVLEKSLPRLHLEWTPVALLARHRLALRAEEGPTSYLSSMLLRYEKFNCTEPSDNVYALFNLIGSHREFLTVDYNQTIADRCCTTLHFMQKHEHIPQSEIVRFANLLCKQLNLASEEGVRQTLLSKSNFGGASILTTAFCRGKALPQRESTKVLELRKQAPALRAMPKWSLQRKESCWEIQPDADHSQLEIIPGADTVSPQDLSYFSIADTQSIGLATNKIETGDEIWHFMHMNLAFIVRNHDIVGRSLIFESNGPSNVDRLEDETKSATKNDLTSPKPESALQQHEILLTYPDLFDLTFWADSMEPETSPFS